MTNDWLRSPRLFATSEDAPSGGGRDELPAPRSFVALVVLDAPSRVHAAPAGAPVLQQLHLGASRGHGCSACSDVVQDVRASTVLAQVGHAGYQDAGVYGVPDMDGLLPTPDILTDGR